MIFIIVAVFAMVVLKDVVNKKESMLAMQQLGIEISKYKKENGVIPSQSYVDAIVQRLPGNVRVGSIKYRALWINLDSTPDDILAYTEKKYPLSFLIDGFIVLKLSGQVEWMAPEAFKDLLRSQQSPLEIQTTPKELQR